MNHRRFIPYRFGSEAVGVGKELIITSLDESGQGKTKLSIKFPAKMTALFVP